MAQKIFFKYIFPVVIIIGLCITAYFVLTKPIDELANSTENRILETIGYETALSNSRIDALGNKTTTFFIVIFGLVGILLFIGFHAFKLILSIDNDYLVNPDKYKIVTVEEEECLKYIKDKFLEKEIIRKGELLEKEHIIKMLANNLS